MRPFNSLILYTVCLVALAVATGTAQNTFPENADQLRRSAERGDPNAQFNLGVLYDSGSGVVQD